MNDILDFDAVVLETECPDCKGLGGGKDGKYSRWRCSNCKGTGYVPTAFGEKVLGLLRHNFRPMLQDAQDE